MTTATQPVLAADFDVSSIDPNPDNVRKDIGDVTELAASIKAHGVLEPVVVYQHPTDEGRFMLLYGHRRLAAAQLAKIKKIPAIERTAPGRAELIEMMLAENLHRNALTPMDEALALVEIKRSGAKSVKAIAAAVNMSSAWVSARLAIVAKLPEDVWDLIRDGDLSVTDAVTIAQAPGLDLEQRRTIAKEKPANRRYKLDEIAKANREAERLTQIAKEWPGRVVTNHDPRHYGYKFDTRFGLARYGDAPGNINLPPEMGDPEMQVVYVDQYRSAAPIELWHRAPELLDDESFVPLAGEPEALRDGQVRLKCGGKNPSMILVADLPGAPTKLGGWALNQIHSHCPGHAEMFVPWSSPIKVCITPTAHNARGKVKWDDLIADRDAAIAAGKVEQQAASAPRWREALGPDVAALVDVKLRAIIESIPAGVLSALLYVERWSLYAEPDTEVDGQVLKVDDLVDDLGTVIEQAILEVTENGEREANMLEARWVLDVMIEAGAEPPERLERVFNPPDPTEFFAALEAALDSGATVYGVDEEAVDELGSALAEAGWTVDSDGEAGEFAITITAGDGRSFVMATADREADTDAA